MCSVSVCKNRLPIAASGWRQRKMVSGQAEMRLGL
jgi:hypothetical protein